jgi:hypothetical protein
VIKSGRMWSQDCPGLYLQPSLGRDAYRGQGLRSPDHDEICRKRLSKGNRETLHVDYHGEREHQITEVKMCEFDRQALLV